MVYCQVGRWFLGGGVSLCWFSDAMENFFVGQKNFLVGCGVSSNMVNMYVQMNECLLRLMTKGCVHGWNVN